MNQILRFGIGARLGVGFGFLVLLMLVLTQQSVTQVNDINQNLGQINDVNSVKQRYAINFRGSVHDRAIAVRDVTLVQTGEERQATVALIAKIAASYAANETKMADMVSSSSGASAEEKAILAEIADIQSKTNPLVGQIIDLQEKATSRRQRKSCWSRPGRCLWHGWDLSTNSSTIRRL